MLIVLLSHSGSGTGVWPYTTRRRAAVLGRPVVADGQAELVGLAGGLAVQRELAHLAGAAALERLLEAGVGDDQLAVVEHVMADEPVEEARARSALNSGGSAAELRERFGEAVGDLDLAAAQSLRRA